MMCPCQDVNHLQFQPRQEVQTTDWLEEQTCANRILLSSASQQPVPDPQQARCLARVSFESAKSSKGHPYGGCPRAISLIFLCLIGVVSVWSDFVKFGGYGF